MLNLRTLCSWSKTEVINGATVKKPLAVMIDHQKARELSLNLKKLYTYPLSFFDVVDNIQVSHRVRNVWTLPPDEVPLTDLANHLFCRQLRCSS